jgi:hypothetical protein
MYIAMIATYFVVMYCLSFPTVKWLYHKGEIPTNSCSIYIIFFPVIFPIFLFIGLPMMVIVLLITIAYDKFNEWILTKIDKDSNY